MWNKRNQLIAAAVAAVIAAWLLWPSRYARVANLGSHGSSVIAFGDSLTAGYGAQPGQDYPSKLSSLIGTTVINAGVSGDTTESALARIDNDVLSRDPRMVILGFRFPSLGASYEKMYASVASDERCLLIPDLLDGILSNPSLKSDEIHPNVRGYQLMAERVAGPCRKLIRKADAAR